MILDWYWDEKKNKNMAAVFCRAKKLVDNAQWIQCLRARLQPANERQKVTEFLNRSLTGSNNL